MASYFGDEREIGPEALAMLQKVLADLLREAAGSATKTEELALARELVMLSKSDFRSSKNSLQMVQRTPPLDSRGSTPAAGAALASGFVAANGRSIKSSYKQVI